MASSEGKALSQAINAKVYATVICRTILVLVLPVAGGCGESTQQPDGASDGAMDVATSGVEALVGRWTSDLDGTQLEIADDGTFRVSLADAEGKSISGTYLLDGDIIVFRNSPDALRCAEDPGRYRWRRDDEGTLQFELVEDACQSRIDHLNEPFRRIGP